MGYGLLSKLITGADGLVGNQIFQLEFNLNLGCCEKNKVTKRIIQENVDKINLKFDSQDSVSSSVGMKDYDISLTGVTFSS